MSKTSNETEPASLPGLVGPVGIGVIVLLLVSAMVLTALATSGLSRRAAGPASATTGPLVAGLTSVAVRATGSPAAPTEAGPAATTPEAASASPPAEAALTAVASPSITATTSAPDTATPTELGQAPTTPAPTATATPTLFPMSIAAMRQGSYPGSDIVIEKELPSGATYRRYYASYQSEGLKIYALLTIPFGRPPATGWPVIVFNHGYIPPEVYRTTERYEEYVDRLAQAGYIVFRSDYRGHGQSEGEDRGAYSDPDYVVDVLNAVAAVKRLPDADPERVGMWGHSMGGYITLRAMVISPDIRAGVIWGGVVAPYPDLFARGNLSLTPTPLPEGTPPPDPTGWRAWLVEYGSREANPAFWDSVSANAYLTEISGPLQLHHGTADRDVPLAASELLYAEMQAAERPVEFYTYKDDNHNLAGYFTLAMNRTIAFFDTYLKP